MLYRMSPQIGHSARPDHYRNARLVPSRDGSFDSGHFFELDLPKKQIAPAAATVNFRARVRQFGRRRRTCDRALSLRLAERAGLEIDQGVAGAASTPGADSCCSFCFGRSAGPVLSPRGGFTRTW